MKRIQEAPVSLSQSTDFSLPLTLPWGPLESPVMPGTTFFSRLSSSADPWSKRSPFLKKSLDDITLQYDNGDGGTATYQSSETTMSSTSSEHLSLAFGITVGNQWLNVSVTGGYDKDTLENSDGRKFSMRASFRCGSVMLLEKPRLSKEARILLKYGGGIEEFKKRYGDYYVAGYRLGGDAGVLVSESRSSKAVNERLSVTPSAKLLFITVSKTYEKFFSSASKESCYRIHGFDTLENQSIPAEAPISVYSESGIADLLTKAAVLEKHCLKLAERAYRQIEATGLRSGQEVEAQILVELLRSNLVVEICLLPICRLREVIEWSISKDII
ncbi:hypothetical protein BFJ70_g184 [Fusarium oxysporum]|uniref:Uncharacterized protein n=1 Tax=Fusarium oxysporum Fo47 TaxID=660027 RepID=W9JFD5_FUSOX|nr:uncharacterized protein FOBCDRAFT_281588 [Fusarium oxysporum Fo47]EWZ30626.1 hypothetical protein FOZG_16099 [Fusarium oxysporum Fo47]QKD61952.1 hypothetical protein FOBCDRAFT_281588 [Fusarium oxysporum Fo47]RKL51463.1 hypothetical protein BFJ70_g184 [Fusarium oxysporum]